MAVKGGIEGTRRPGRTKERNEGIKRRLFARIWRMDGHRTKDDDESPKFLECDYINFMLWSFIANRVVSFSFSSLLLGMMMVIICPWLGNSRPSLWVGGCYWWLFASQKNNIMMKMMYSPRSDGQRATRVCIYSGWIMCSTEIGPIAIYRIFTDPLNRMGWKTSTGFITGDK